MAQEQMQHNSKKIKHIFYKIVCSISFRITVFADSVVKNDPSSCSPAVFSGSVPNSCVGQICIINKLKGFSTILAGGDPLEYACRLLVSGRAQYILTGSVEEYYPPLYGAYDVLDAAKGCNLSEGAAMAVLSAVRTSDTYCRVTGSASVNLGFCPLLCRPDGSGDLSARIEKTLQQFSAPDTYYSSGNGTWFDAAEQQAVREAFPDSTIHLPKEAFGETLGCGYMMNVLYAAAAIHLGKCTRALVSGIDMIGNYTCVMLEK